jgi:O-antigen/teichoic acid export membrane protein
MIGALSVGFLNYAFYPIMGRILQPTAFGEVQVLFSLFAQITIFLNVLSLITVTIVANYSDSVKRDAMVKELEKLALWCSVALVFGALIFAPVLRSFFHFNHTLPFVLLAVAILAGTPLAFRSGFLRGQKKFGLVTIASLAASIGNILFSVSLALAGFGSIGALAGLAIGQFAAFNLAAFFAHKHGLRSRQSQSEKSKTKKIVDFKFVAPELRYAGLVLIGSLCVTSLYTLDTVVAKHYFDATTAGLYAGIATIARIIFFATASVLQVMLPSIKRNASTQQNQRLLSKSLTLLLVVGGLPLAVFALFPQKITGLLMGDSYLPFAHLLPWLGLAMLIIAVLNMLIMYHIALRRYAAGAIAAIGIVLTYGLLTTHHQSPDQVVASICIGSTLNLLILGVWSGMRAINRGTLSVRTRLQEGGPEL